jgi:threonine/homoserine/homoserine lactone efflux protein
VGLRIATGSSSTPGYNAKTPDTTHFALFLGAAILLVLTPGPGLFYVLARSLAGGRKEGVLSSLGTFVGGIVQVVAAATGLSALLATSALTFSIVNYAGAGYLIYLGVRMIKASNEALPTASVEPVQRNSFRQGIWTEVLNPKTALFFLAFVPQFVSPMKGHLFLQFVMLGGLSVALNTSADLVVATFAGTVSDNLKRNPRIQRRQRLASGFGMIGLGVYVGCSGSGHAE